MTNFIKLTPPRLGEKNVQLTKRYYVNNTAATRITAIKIKTTTSIILV